MISYTFQAFNIISKQNVSVFYLLFDRPFDQILTTRVPKKLYDIDEKAIKKRVSSSFIGQIVSFLSKQKLF